ncbi:MAG: site-specific integrase [Gaiellaceae bacterium]
MRLGELRALRPEDVDLEAGVIRVERSWDPLAGLFEPKSRAGRRTVPIVAALRTHLAAHKLRSPGGTFFFGEGDRPFNREKLVSRAEKAWKEAKLEPLGLHEARHTCASIFIAAGVNVKALSTYLGHATPTSHARQLRDSRDSGRAYSASSGVVSCVSSRRPTTAQPCGFRPS